MIRARMRAMVVGLLAAAPLAMAAAGGAAGDGLKRKAYFGAALGPAEGGVEIREVLPGSPAEAGGLQGGDVVASFNRGKVSAPGDVVAAVARAEAGSSVEVDIVRDGEPLTKSIKLGERPREKSDAYEVVYGSITSGDSELRTLVTRPRGEGKRPALLLIQGLGCVSVDNPSLAVDGYRKILDDFTRAGYVTMRVDKPGCGDSEGGPCPDVDFTTELDGYRQALKALKALDGVDPENVLIFGHSMGGVMAPILAAENPVKGIAVYGTVFKTWVEYEIENLRRQLVLAGVPFPEIDRRLRREILIRHLLYVEGKTPAQVAEAHPDLADAIKELAEDGEHMYGRNVAFFRQLAETNLPEAWSKVDAHVLAMWGQAEYVSTEADHALIAEQVNRAHPGKGTFLVLEGTDHGFDKAESPEARFGRQGPGEFNPAVIEALRAWADPIAQPKA